MKNFYLFIICLLLGAGVHAQTWYVGYPTAANVKATLSNGTLTISGTGAMADYNSTSDIPWGSLFISRLNIGSGVTHIGNYAFYGCDVASVTIGNSVETIGEGAFTRCTNLTSVTIPNSVTAIGGGAFYGCTGLTRITNHATTPQVISIYDNVFTGVSTTACTLRVPVSSVEIYRAANVWKDFMNIVAIGGTNHSVTNVPVMPNPASVQKSQSRQFTANVTAAGGASEAVTWSVTGSTSAGTSISTSGLLTVAAGENGNFDLRQHEEKHGDGNGGKHHRR